MTSSGGATAHPIFQPVNENVLPPEEIVTVRSRMPGSDGDRDVDAVEHEVLVHLVADDEEVVLDGDARPRRRARRRVNTLPVGLCGVLRRMRRVRGVTAARRASTSRAKSGARSVTGRRSPPAMAMQAA